MDEKNLEIEVKFYIWDLNTMEVRLQELGAKKVQPRTHEYNLRFDTPAGELVQQNQVLRLRKDTADRVTFKGPGVVQEGVYHRKEIEFEVSDFNAAQAFLEALGYQVSMIYEKFRTVYALGEVLVTLDEMPFGNFIEIEGPDSHSIQETSRMLGLPWVVRIAASYASLFQAACQAAGLETNQLTFAAFAGRDLRPEHLGVQPAQDSP